MPTSLNTSRETSDHVYRSWRIGIYALPALLGVALVGFLLSHPDASRWISDAAQAEFADTFVSPDIAPPQLAQPAKDIRTAKAN